MHITFVRSNFGLAFATLLAACSVALIAPDASAQPGSDTQLRQERAACNVVQQDRTACLREAGAAQQAARRNGLTSAAADYDKNASARCLRQPPADRADCEARVHGGGMSSSQGSVMGGGILRETITTIPATTK